MIWGMTLHPGVVYTREVMAVEYMTLASLDCRPGLNAEGSNPMAHLKLQTNDTEYIVCTLEKGIVHQQSLEYVLQDGDNLKFTVEGNSAMYITGYTYRHPVMSDRACDRGVTSSMVRIAPNGIHNDLSLALSTDSEGSQPRIIEGTVASVKNEPVNVNMEVDQDGNGGQTDPQVEEFLTGTDEDLTEPEDNQLHERPNPMSANTSGVQEYTEEESDQRLMEISLLSETITEGTADYQDTDTSVLADTSSMKVETEGMLDLEPHRQTTLPNETVTEGTVDSHDSEDPEPLLPARREQIQQATDQGLIGTNIFSVPSDSEPTEGAEACQSLNDEIIFHSNMVEEGGDAIESLSNEEVSGSPEVTEEVTESEDRETVKESNENQEGNKDLLFCNAGLKMKKVTIALHRVDRFTFCRSSESSDDCSGHQLGGNGGLHQVETEASECTIENQIAEKNVLGQVSDIEMANILLELHSGKCISHPKESSLNSNMDAIDGEGIRTGDNGTESTTSNRSPAIPNEEERLSNMRRQESELKPTDCIQKINGSRLDVNVSSDKGPVSTCSQTRTTDEHTGQHSNQKKLQKQLNRKEELISTSVERRLRSATKTTKIRNIPTSLQGSAPYQVKSGSRPTSRSIQSTKRILIRRKNITQSKVITSKKVSLSKRKVLVNDSKHAGNKLNNVNTGKKPYSCQFCKKMFASKLDLMVHKRSHNGEKSFQCKYCEKNFTFRSYLLRHERIHTGEKPYNCNFCEKRFTMKSNVMAHERIHTGKYPFKCTFCGKKFGCKSKMKYHENIHTGKMLFECKYCEKKFTMKSFLVCHERIHTGEKPFHCNYCVKKFVQKVQMVKHERTHTGEKPFSCQYCAKKFAVKSVLKYHERTHTGEKAFKCQYCDKKFTWRKNWLDHTRIHTDDRPFSCKYCEKKFFQKIILLQHEAVHTGEKRFKCKYCKKGFAWKNNLMRHERKFHTS